MERTPQHRPAVKSRAALDSARRTREETDPASHVAVLRGVKSEAAVDLAERGDAIGIELDGALPAVARQREFAEARVLLVRAGRGLDGDVGVVQLGPNLAPGLLAQAAPGELATARLLEPAGATGVHVAQAGEALVEVLLVDAVRSREAAPVLGGDLLHTPDLSDSLADAQAIRYPGRHRKSPSHALERTSVETNAQRRRRKLQVLVSAHGIKEVAKQAKRSSDYLYQILAGTLLPTKVDGSRSERSLGDDAARAIEEAYGLDRGWFDNDEEESTMTPDELLLLGYFRKLDTETQAIAIENLRIALEESARIRERLRTPLLQAARPALEDGQPRRPRR